MDNLELESLETDNECDSGILRKEKSHRLIYNLALIYVSIILGLMALSLIFVFLYTLYDLLGILGVILLIIVVTFCFSIDYIITHEF